MNRTLLGQLRDLRDHNHAGALDVLTEEELDQHIEDGIRFLLTVHADLYPTAEALIESYENSDDPTDKEVAPRVREWLEKYARKAA